ncbi:aa3-type cytochrome c oxidase subunit IV [Sphingomonas mesophila]|nr:aa3-type cytochrome c oxidase subunit IV [Sphingomonas mesophila]
MAELPSSQGGHDPNFPAHARNYEGFLKLTKWSVIVTAIITAAVILIISN